MYANHVGVLWNGHKPKYMAMASRESTLARKLKDTTILSYVLRYCHNIILPKSRVSL